MYKIAVEFFEVTEGECKWQSKVVAWLPIDMGNQELHPDFINRQARVLGEFLHPYWGWVEDDGVCRQRELRLTCDSQAECKTQAFRVISDTITEIERVVARNLEVFGREGLRQTIRLVTLPSKDSYWCEINYSLSGNLVCAHVKLLLPAQGEGPWLRLSERFQHPTMSVFGCNLVQAWGNSVSLKSGTYMYRDQTLSADTMAELETSVGSLLADTYETLASIQQALNLIGASEVTADKPEPEPELDYLISIRNWKVSGSLEVEADVFIYLPIDPVSGSIWPVLQSPNQYFFDQPLYQQWGVHILKGSNQGHPEGTLGRYRYRRQTLTAKTVADLENQIVKLKLDTRDTLHQLIDQTRKASQIILPADQLDRFRLD